MMVEAFVRQSLFSVEASRGAPAADRYCPPDRKFLYMLGRAGHVQAPTDSPYIGRVTVMVVPSFSLLLKAMVP